MKTEAQKSSEPEIKGIPVKEPRNKGNLMGQKPPLKLKEVGGILIRLQRGMSLRELVLFNLAIYSKLRDCDQVKLKGREQDKFSYSAAVLRRLTELSTHVQF